MLMEMNYNLLLRWFVGLEMDETGVGRDGVYQESGAADGGGNFAEVFTGGVKASKGVAEQ
jgi:hypothetical protein